MILFNTNNYIINPEAIRVIYLNLLELKLKSNPNLYNLKNIEKLIEDNKIPNIRYLFNAIDIDSKGNIYFYDHDREGRVLRYIEFGGEYIKPTHILKDTARDLVKIIH